jgi:hypothetical protein
MPLTPWIPCDAGGALNALNALDSLNALNPLEAGRAPVAPVAPCEVMPMSSRRGVACLVVLLGVKEHVARARLSAKPKFDAGLVIQPCTTEVTSNVT